LSKQVKSKLDLINNKENIKYTPNDISDATLLEGGDPSMQKKEVNGSDNNLTSRSRITQNKENSEDFEINTDKDRNDVAYENAEMAIC
jgi:hypothetical protein